MRGCVYEYSCVPQRIKLKRNAYCTIACGHLCAFRIAHNQAHQIGSRLNVKTRFQGESRAAEPVNGSVEQFHLDDFFSAGNEIAVLVKNCRRNGKVVVVASLRFSKVN